MADVPPREVLREPAAELKQAVSGVVGIGLRRAEMGLIPVDLDCDLQLWIGEVDAEAP